MGNKLELIDYVIDSDIILLNYILILVCVCLGYACQFFSLFVEN